MAADNPGRRAIGPAFACSCRLSAWMRHSADMYWRAAIVPARSYRVHEGFLFNQRVVQFVLDPEGTAAGAAAWKTMPGLWQLVLDAVDEVVGSERDDRREQQPWLNRARSMGCYGTTVSN